MPGARVSCDQPLRYFLTEPRATLRPNRDGAGVRWSSRYRSSAPRDPGPPASAPCDLWLCHAAPEATRPLKFSFIPNLRRMMDEKCVARWSEFDYGWYVIPAWPTEWIVAFCAIQPKNKVGRQVSNGNAFLESSVDLLGTAWSWRMTRAQPHSSLAGAKSGHRNINELFTICYWSELKQDFM